MEWKPCSVPGCGKESSAVVTRLTLNGRLPPVTRQYACDEHRVFPDSDRLFHYLLCRTEGTGHRLAEMFAEQRPPQSNTDVEFLRGHCNGNQFEGREAEGNHYRRIAEAGGQDTTGKVYLGGLARFPGDPEAWVAGRGDAERVLDRRGWGADGIVKRNVTRVGEPEDVGVDGGLIAQEIHDVLGVVDDPEAVDTVDLAEQIFNRKKPHWSKATFSPERYGMIERGA